MPNRLNRHISRSLYWDVHTGTGHASYGASLLTLQRPPKLHGVPVEAVDYSPLVHLTSVLETHPGTWRQLTHDEMVDIDTRLKAMVSSGLAVWD